MHSTAGHKRRLILPVGVVHQFGPPMAMGTQMSPSPPFNPDATSVKYHLYEVDDLLGRLRDTTLLSRLYRLYLHALTSHQLVDPLLKRTGTEEALQGLAQGETFSFQTLLPEEITLLKKSDNSRQSGISLEANQVMETVQWEYHLPPTSEHYGFAAAVRKIWDYWMSIRVFYPDSHSMQGWGQFILAGISGEAHKKLTRRSAVRNALYAPTQCF
jgi:hypothetical protein